MSDVPNALRFVWYRREIAVLYVAVRDEGGLLFGAIVWIRQ